MTHRRLPTALRRLTKRLTTPSYSGSSEETGLESLAWTTVSMFRGICSNSPRLWKPCAVWFAFAVEYRPCPRVCRQWWFGSGRPWHCSTCRRRGDKRRSTCNRSAARNSRRSSSAGSRCRTCDRDSPESRDSGRRFCSTCRSRDESIAGTDVGSPDRMCRRHRTKNKKTRQSMRGGGEEKILERRTKIVI